jgi:hypothetical protein
MFYQSIAQYGWSFYSLISNNAFGLFFHYYALRNDATSLWVSPHPRNSGYPSGSVTLNHLLNFRPSVVFFQPVLLALLFTSPPSLLLFFSIVGHFGLLVCFSCIRLHARDCVIRCRKSSYKIRKHFFQCVLYLLIAFHQQNQHWKMTTIRYKPPVT